MNPLSPEAIFAITRMRQAARNADRARRAALRAKKESMAHTAMELRDGYRESLGGNDTVAESLAAKDPDYRVAVSDNQWFISQANMWANVALIEMKLTEYDDDTRNRLLEADTSRAQ